MTETAYQGAIFDVQKVHPTVNGKSIDRDLVHMHQNAIIAGVFNIKTNQMLITKEYRTGVNNVTYGFIAGKIEPNEDYMQAVVREIKEETGIMPNILMDVPNQPFYTSEGFTDETIQPILIIIDGFEQTKTNFDKDEYVKYSWVNIDEFDNHQLSGLPAQYLYQQFILLDLTGLFTQP